MGGQRTKRARKAGHRSWVLKDGRVTGQHRGDIMSPETRSEVMSRIRGKNTGPERVIARKLRARKLEFEIHAKDLPGCPDFLFRQAMVAVFVDGDFWHGWRFPLWAHKLSVPWREKIAATRARDQRNFRKLRSLGWRVLRIWEHQVERNPTLCVQKIVDAIAAANS